MLNSAPFCIVESKTEVFEICLFAPRMHWICTSEISRLCSAVVSLSHFSLDCCEKHFMNDMGLKRQNKLIPFMANP